LGRITTSSGRQFFGVYKSIYFLKRTDRTISKQLTTTTTGMRAILDLLAENPMLKEEEVAVSCDY